MKKILVTGVGGPAGRSLAALLAERGYSPVGVDMQSLPANGFPFFQVPPAKDPAFLSAVHQVANENGADLIIPTVSEELPVFASQWQYGDRQPVLVPSARAVEIANDKYRTALALAQHGVAVPRFLLPSQAQSPDDIARAIGWPCISKPRIGRGGREVELRFEQDFSTIVSLGDGYILQEFAPGTDFAPNVFTTHHGDDLVVVLEKTELKHGILGNAVSVRRVDAKDVAATALAAARALQLYGPADIDIRQRADGVPVVLEINARFGANIRFAPEILEAALSQAETAG